MILKANMIQLFSEKNISIIKIAVGNRYALFSDESGVIWGCDEGRKLGMDIKSFQKVFVPKETDYFVNNSIKVKDVETGYDHPLAVDMNGKVYSWGSNDSGQCGFANENYVFLPKKIKAFDDSVVSKM